LTQGVPLEHVERKLRFALWNRVAELIAQECESNDREFAHAKRRLEEFIATDLLLTNCVEFTQSGVHYVALAVALEQRTLPILPRDVLEKVIAVPASALKYGDGLSQFVVDVLTAVELAGLYRPWLSVDDLAFVIARAEELVNQKDWMKEQIAGTPEDFVIDLQTILPTAADRVLMWFDDKYSVRKQFEPVLAGAMRAAFNDHVYQLLHDPGNHPGLQAILTHHLAISPGSFRNSSFRSDFEYMVRRLRDELQSALVRRAPDDSAKKKFGSKSR
jgi:hypothetical protein